MSEIDIRVMKARSQLVRSQAFFGSLAMRLSPVERNDIPTMAVDGKHLFYAKSFLDKMSADFLLFAVAHEVLHCALGHHTRRNGRDHKRWNIACDYVVNWILKLAGFKIPDWVFIDPEFADFNAEEIYRILEKRERDQKQKQQEQPTVSQASNQESDETEQGNGTSVPEESDEDSDAADNQNQGDDQCNSDGSSDGSDSNSDDGMSATPDEADASQDAGSSSDEASEDGKPSDSSGGTSTQTPSTDPVSCGDPGGIGEVLDAAPEQDRAAMAEAADEWQVYTRQAANIARRQGAGKLPGFIEEVVEALHDPQTDWREKLRRFVDPVSATKDFSWSIPNRRYSPFGFYTPGVISDGQHKVALLIDSSASVLTPWLQKFGGEAQAALDNGAIDEVVLVFIDTQINRVERYRKGDVMDFTVQGRGGTRFAPAFEWLNENEPDVAVAVYFTDGECSDFGPEPPYPVLWMVYGDDPRYTRRNMEQIPWGECAELE